MTAAWQSALEDLHRAPDAALDALLAAAPDDAEAALALALLLLESGADEEGGLHWLTVAAQAGTPGARRLLARATLQGRASAHPDGREAVRLLMQAALDGEEGALDDLVQLALLLDDALLFDAALGLEGGPMVLRLAFLEAVRVRAPGWFATFGEPLEAALGLDGDEGEGGESTDVGAAPGTPQG